MTDLPHAYATGRNSVWMERGPSCPFTHPKEVEFFKAGRRDALADLRLDADTEWDDEIDNHCL